MRRIEARRLAMALLLAVIASAPAGGAEPPIVAVELQLQGMRALTADWESGDRERVQRDLVDLLQRSLSPWTFGVLEGEVPYRLSFKVENTKSEQIHVYVRLLVDGKDKAEIDLSPVRGHVDDLLLLEPEEVAGWLADRLVSGRHMEQENRGRLSRLRARLEEHVPIAQEGRWLVRQECLQNRVPLVGSRQECLHIHLPLAESRHGELGNELFRLECVRRMQKATERSRVHASGINLWLPYDSGVLDKHLIVKLIELVSTGELYQPDDKPLEEFRQHKPKAVYLLSFTFDQDDRPRRIHYRRVP